MLYGAINPGLVFGQSSGSVLLGQTKYAVKPGSQAFQRGFQYQAGKASATSKFNWQNAAGHSAVTLLTRAATIGMGVLGAVYTYDRLLSQDVPSRINESESVSRIERGAQDFGTGYGGALPYSYQAGQEAMLDARMTLYEEEQMRRAAIDQAVYEYRKSIELPQNSETLKTGAKTAYIPTIL